MSKHPLEGKYLAWLYTEHCGFEKVTGLRIDYFDKRRIEKVFDPFICSGACEPQRFWAGAYSIDTAKRLAIEELQRRKVREVTAVCLSEEYGDFYNVVLGYTFLGRIGSEPWDENWYEVRPLDEIEDFEELNLLKRSGIQVNWFYDVEKFYRKFDYSFLEP